MSLAHVVQRGVPASACACSPAAMCAATCAVSQTSTRAAFCRTERRDGTPTQAHVGHSSHLLGLAQHVDQLARAWLVIGAHEEGVRHAWQLRLIGV